jgi:glycosyltransferase involved in cell wall biosynthesis
MASSACRCWGGASTPGCSRPSGATSGCAANGTQPATAACAPEKNVGLALQTFERLSARRPGLQMVVVGDGPQRARLERAHPHVRFVGVQTGVDLARHYASADVFLFPSLTDTFGNVVLEALASGLSVAAFDTSAAGQHVRDGVSGSLAPLCWAQGSAEPGRPAQERSPARDSLGAADAFLDAATRALDAAAPDSLLRMEARLAAVQADWDGVLRRFDQQLQQLAQARQMVTRYAAVA